MARLNQDRQKELEPKRMDYALAQITAKGYEITHWDDKKIQFIHKGEKVTLYPYSGWHSGKSIRDGRGIKELLDQLV